MASHIEPFGDRALLVTLGHSIDPLINARVHRLADAIRERGIEGLGAPVPGYASLLVPFDPQRVEVERVVEIVREELAAPADNGAGEAAEVSTAIEIPVSYGGEGGPDLDEVAARLGRYAEEVVAFHAGTEYQVYMLGFSPGFAYLGVLPQDTAGHQAG